MSDRSDLDPQDWDAFRSQAHSLLDACIDRLAQARDLPWRPLPEDVRAGYGVRADGTGEGPIADRLRDDIMPYATGNTHPRFFGWVHGTGLASGLLSEMVAATMNSNCGGRDHSLIHIERAVVDWCRQVFGFPKGASGLLVGGTSQATVIALAAARLRALGAETRKSGLGDARLTAYASASAHGCVGKALDLLGIGSDALRPIADGDRGMDLEILRTTIAKDRAAGARPFAVVGTAGSVDFGAFDDLEGLADLARDEDLWLHVDGAFGAWIRLADTPWRDLARGIDRADSLACDFHKWMYVPYDAALVLIRDEAEHRAAFAGRGSYLAGATRGLATGEPWPCDYGIDLSRGGRALKIWTALETYGADRLGAAITDNCRRAAQMGALVSATPRMALCAPVVSNLCVFTADDSLPAAAQSALNARIAEDLQLDGEAVFSTVRAGEVMALRAAITNHRTTAADIEQTIAAATRVRDGTETAARATDVMET